MMSNVKNFIAQINMKPDEQYDKTYRKGESAMKKFVMCCDLSRFML